MLKILTRWLKIYQDEISLFLWSSLLLFLIRSSNILFNNFAETAFLKRFGVEYLPMIFMINSLSTFFIMGFLTGIMTRIPGSRMLSYMLLVCGVSVASFRLVVPLGFDILYPVLYILKSQYEVLLGLLFWNLANDLFNTRQSKRIFPLITAGGVMGGVIGSFGTPFLSAAISIDNLMWVYLGTTLFGALVVKRMGVLFPTLLMPEKKEKKVKKRAALTEEFKKVLPMIKESDLVKILILLTLIPNVIIPIINYQFNYAIDQTFATEGGMIKFFGYFRGTMNAVSFVILLFVGRIYGRWGLPIALMFHPINYVIAFAAFLFRFDIFSAIYARLSTTVLRNTINNPARAVLMGLFPVSYRAVIRPFLRGTVVRIGTLFGSGLIILFEGILHPRYLSVIAIIFTAGWIVTTFFLKKVYSRILLDLISKNMLDLKSLEETDVGEIFRDKKIHSQLTEAFLTSKGSSCLWYAGLIKSLGLEGLDNHILSIIKEQDDATKMGLIGLLSPEAGSGAVRVLQGLATPEKPELTIAVIGAALTISGKESTDFLKKSFDGFENPQIKAHALIGLYRNEPERYRATIDSWLVSADIAERKAGIMAAGRSRESGYIQTLTDLLEREEDASTLGLILGALHHIEAPEINRTVMPFLTHPSEIVRLAALNACQVSDDRAIRAVIPLLGDPAPEVQSFSKEKLHESSFQNPILLIESLVLPDRKVREGLFSLTAVPSWRVAYLSILKRFNELGIDEINGHLLYDIPDSAYELAYAWLDQATVFSQMEKLLDAHRQDRVVPVEALLNEAANAFGQLWEAQAGLKTFGQAVADAMNFHIEEGQEFDVTADEWLEWSSTASHGEALEKARGMGISVTWDCELARTPDGYYPIQGGIECAIARSLAVAPYCDLIWMETKTANLPYAQRFAEAIHARFPEKMLAYNLSPSFNWDTTGMTEDEMRDFRDELGKLGYVFDFITYGGHQVDGMAAEEFATALRQDGMLSLARLQRKLRLVESPYKTPQSLVGGPRLDGALMASSGRTATTAAMGKGSTQVQHLVQTEVPVRLLEEWLLLWAQENRFSGPLRAELRPHTAGSELLSLNLINPADVKVANIIFATIRDRRGQRILSIRDQETYDSTLRKKRLMTLLTLFLIHRYKITSVHYVSPNEDNQKQSSRMREIGIFDEVRSEVGHIIVASVNGKRLAELLHQDRASLERLIAKR